MSRNPETLGGASLVSSQFSDGRREKRKGRKPLGSGPENLLEGQVYGPEILAAKTTNWISMQQVIIEF